MSNLLFDEQVKSFIKSCNFHGVKMIMVGGGAVNFHGYQRHSADVDFWIDIRAENMQKLVKVVQDLGFDITAFPAKIMKQEQNISIKISPIVDIELITNFNFGKSFDEAYDSAVETSLDDLFIMKYNVLSLEDLIESKVKSSRPKDFLDIVELKRINAL